MKDIVRGHTASVSAHGVVFFAGQVGYDKEFQIVPGGLDAQMRQALVNLADILDAAGLTADRIAQLSLFFKETEDLVIRDALGTFLDLKDEILPGSVAVGFACSVSSLLEPDLLFEVQASAFE